VPLSKWQIKPGFDKQNSEVGAVARYVGGDNVRFRYTLPEKVGGWKAEGGESISSVSRKLHAFRGNDGNKYLAIGTDKFLLIYYEDNFYDITPYRSSGFPLTIDEFKNSTFSTVSGSNVVTITTQSINGLSAGDIVEFENVSLPLPTISSTLSENIDATQDYLPIADTSSFSAPGAAVITSTNEQISFSSISENLLRRSEEMSNAAVWQQLSGATVTADTTVAPNGTTTADTLNIAAATGSAISQGGISVPSTGNYTFSVYVKRVGGVNQDGRLLISDGLSSSLVSFTATDVWQRVSMTKNVSATTLTVQIRNDAVGGTKTIAVWGAMLNQGISPQVYFPTTVSALEALTTVTRGANGTTAQPATLGDTITELDTGYDNSDFEDKLYEVKTIVSDTQFTVTPTSNATNTLTGGTATVIPLENVGNQIQQFQFGWGTGVWNGSQAWGQVASTNGVNTPPGLWSLSNFGQVLVATVLNGKTFTWNPASGNPLGQRASVLTSGFETDLNPTNTRISMVSPTTRHLIHMGTETTIGTPSTQDDMFIRFSSQEEINTYDITAGNSAGSQRIQDGTKIMGAIKSKEAILIWTDNALYLMRHIGQPFVFGFEQVGTNCGLVGQNAVVEVDGVAFWMSDKGFFKYDGSVKTMDCSVEDYVYDDIDLTQGQQIYAGVNNLYTEIRWDYPSASSDYNNRYVIYNFAEGVWYTGNTPRTSWADANVFEKPFATEFDNTTNGDFPEVIGEPAAPNGYGKTILYNHEVGTDQENLDGSITRITSNIESFDFDISSPQMGDGEFFLSMRRFIPDFKTLVGTARVTLTLKRYPSDTGTPSTYSSFDVTSTTDKKDTRARGRFLSIKIENPGLADGENWRYGTLRIDIQPDGRR